MKLYKVIKNGIETNGWTSDSGKDETHYEPGFGKPERWVRANDGEDVSQAMETRFYEVEPARPAVYEDQVVTIPPVVDEQGNEVEAARQEIIKTEVEPAVPAVIGLEYKLPAEYTIDVVDLTEQLKAEKQKRKERQQKRKILRSLKKKTLTAAETRQAVELLLEDYLEDLVDPPDDDDKD